MKYRRDVLQVSLFVIIPSLNCDLDCILKSEIVLSYPTLLNMLSEDSSGFDILSMNSILCKLYSSSI